MSATVEQQKYAVDHFVRWLAHENELGRYPSEVEIDRVIDLDGEAYVILKYRLKMTANGFLVFAEALFHQELKTTTLFGVSLKNMKKTPSLKNVRVIFKCLKRREKVTQSSTLRC